MGWDIQSRDHDGISHPNVVSDFLIAGLSFDFYDGGKEPVSWLISCFLTPAWLFDDLSLFVISHLLSLYYVWKRGFFQDLQHQSTNI